MQYNRGYGNWESAGIEYVPNEYVGMRALAAWYNKCGCFWMNEEKQWEN